MTALLYFLVYLFPIIGSVAFGYFTCETRSEELLIPKLIGYYFLGTLIFWFGLLPIPAGLAIGYFLFKPQTNRSTKKWVLLIGTMISFISQLTIF
ncbi:hypothetical protein [Evansella tamaricis]|uniref:NADH dehydrogenase subunit 4 n=1 Tax=Evansella tamaricis TaxID=2069301 RepID=A0ABS6JDC8_9BACI|nr:hypothetical protein [Evansella tamaricis]MBU9710857.1 hypothetical protein [Evansella tamaricis]